MAVTKRIVCLANSRKLNGRCIAGREVSRGGALFPHLYAPLDLSAVLWVKPLPLGPSGTHEFPPLEA